MINTSPPKHQSTPWFLAVGLTLFATYLFADDSTPRERQLMDSGWKFHLGDDWGDTSGDSWYTVESLEKASISAGAADPVFCDASFRTVNLPHDWAVELPFDPKADEGGGYKPVGYNFPKNNIGWYRHTFTLPNVDAGKRIWLEFDGVYRDCLVFVNGFRMGRHESGYDSFRYDITDVANCGGENSVAVRVDASKFEGWWYEGAGIYRHVWLDVTAPLAIAPDGIFVHSQFKNNVPKGPAEIRLETRLQNSSKDHARAKVKWQILDPDGKIVADTAETASLDPWDKAMVQGMTKISKPQLWSPESPKLYKLVTTIESDGQIVDREETAFGIRTVAFDPDKGFLLNGRHYEIKGMCNHQDAAGVGIAVPDALWDFRIKKLKEMGCNAYRTTHGEVALEMLDACDRLGMLVMDENRLLGSDPKNMQDVKDQVVRDRNHPSVFLWSIANEECAEDNPVGGRIAATMQRLIQQLDPTRPITCAVASGDVYTGIDGVIQVRGWNYHLGADTDDYHHEHPNQPELCTEQATPGGTRGIYTNDPQQGFVSSYDNPNEEQRTQDWWSFVSLRPWLSGGFAWTGFDYRGEPYPYDWPCISSQFGVLDTCGFPKDNFWYYKAWWTDQPVLHLLPHWNWPGKEDQYIAVSCYSNCKQVELFLNGHSLGRKTMQENSHLEWQVKYEPGTLSARGYDDAGKVIADAKVETTGAPSTIQLDPDRSTINADGKDISVINVAMTDAGGRVVPTAEDLIHFTLSGPGKIIGVGNGDPSCLEPDVYLSQPALRTGTMNQWLMQTVSEAKEYPEVAEKYDFERWTTPVDVNVISGSLKAGEWGVFRAHLFVTETDLEMTNILIRFGAIKDEGWIYVNGKLAGESHDPAASPSFNLKGFLHSGINTLAVLAHCNVGSGGICKGVNVEIPSQPVDANWKRSLFNGLAQVIVQSDGTAGRLDLSANADGLTAATTTIHTVSIGTR